MLMEISYFIWLRPEDHVIYNSTVVLGSSFKQITATVRKQPQCGVIPRLRIPGIVPGGYPEYPDPLRGDFFDRGRENVIRTCAPQLRACAQRRLFTTDIHCAGIRGEYAAY